MNVVEQIRLELDSMTKSERQVASYFLGHLNDFTFHTLDQVAGSAGTSTTSVIRFCRRLGYSGYKALQEQLRKEISYQPTLPAKYKRMKDSSLSDSLLAQTLQQGILCIEKTFSEMPGDALAKATEAIMAAKRVFTFGTKESCALAHYAYTRMLAVRPDAYLLGAYNGCIESIQSLNQEDVCIVFLFHRYSNETLGILPMLKKQGVTIILVTSSPYERLIPYATVLLPCHVDAHGIKNTSLAPVCLMDYLCNAVAVQAGEKTLERMQQLEDLMQTSSILGS